MSTFLSTKLQYNNNNNLNIESIDDVGNKILVDFSSHENDVMTTSESYANDSLVIVDSTLFFYQDLLNLQTQPDDILANESDFNFITSQDNNDTTITFDSTTTTTSTPWWFDIPYPDSGYTKLSVILLVIFLTCIMVLIVVGNLLVCIAISTEKSLKTVQNWFIASLAVSDLLLGLIVMPFSLAYELMGMWIFGNVWCEVHHALDVLLCTASINNLCLISLDRYWSVTQAVQYLKKRTPARAMFMIGFVWCFSALVSLPPLLGWKGKEIEGQCTLSDDMGYVLYSAMGSFYIPALVMVFVYARIFVAARSRARRALKKRKMPQPPSEAVTTVVTVTDPAKDKSTTCTSLSNPSPPDHNRNNNDPHQSSVDSNTMMNRRVGGVAPSTTRLPPSVIVTSSTTCSSNRPQPPTSISPAALMQHSTPEIVVESSSSPMTSPVKTIVDRKYDEKYHVSFSIIETSVSPPLSRSTRTTTTQQEQDQQIQQPAHKPQQLQFSETRFVSEDIEESSSPVGSPTQPQPTRGFLSPASALSKFKASPYGSTLSIADFEDSEMTEPDSDPNKKMSKIGSQSATPTPRLVTSEAERHKRKVAKARERRATLILGLIMASFIGAWLPFFTMYLIQGICKECKIPSPIFTVAFWLGYCNSAINPIIYTVFNRDFRKAFRRLIFR